MVTATDDLFQCDECSLWYKDRQTARECETFCREHGACNAEIVKKAVDK